MAVGTEARTWAEASTGRIVVTNRASSSLSVIDVQTDAVYAIALPPGLSPPEPMYITYSAQTDRLFVGDRANNRVLVFDADTLDFEATVVTGAGVSHQWANRYGRQLWINNDVDNTTVVVDAVTLKRLAVVNTPPDLAARGGRPHDVCVDPRLPFAYVTILGVDDEGDCVLRFSTHTFREEARVEVGGRPRVYIPVRGNRMYVSARTRDEVVVFARSNFRRLESVRVPAAHSITGNPMGREVFVTTKAGYGPNAIVTLHPRGVHPTSVASAVEATVAVPHYLWPTDDGRKLYLTHSGRESDRVSVYRVGPKGLAPSTIGDIGVGLDPCGLTYVP